VLEEGIGQGWLYRLRGPLPPPDQVLVVALDRRSAEVQGLPTRLREWPRDVHARLVERLAAAGATVIVFDLIFERPRDDPDEDQALAAAVRAAERVVLFEKLDSFTRDLRAADGSGALATTVQAIRPIPVLADAAAAVAPFPLPTGPRLVNHFWTFAYGTRSEPTLPLVALELHLAQSRALFWRLVDEFVPMAPDGNDLSMRMAALHRGLAGRDDHRRRLEDRIAQPELDAEVRWQLARRLDIYAGPDARWLNLHGAPGRITTWPARAVLDDARFAGLREQVRGRAVFIGLVELLSPEDDEFQTAYSENGILHAGVEIAATAFANLLEGRTLAPVAGWRLGVLLLAVGLAVGAVATLLPAIAAVPAALLLAVAYTWLATLAFHENRWLPLAIPLLVQLPLGLLAGLFLQYRAARRVGRNLAAGIGYYLPANVASGLADRPSETATRTEMVRGISMVSDVEGFTGLSEKHRAADVSALLNRYFEAIFAAIAREGGLVTDIVGDGITAFWHGTDVATRRAACRAALGMQRSIARLELSPDNRGLPTRIGLNIGEVILGGVGGSGRFAYSLIGNPVDTASRIEKLNKHLGTWLLASGGVVAGVDGLVRRPLGVFILYGKQQPIALEEILDRAPEDPVEPWREQFAMALTAFQDGDLERAAAGFAQVLAERDDGPSHFFLRLCKGDTAQARRQQDGTVLLLDK
jgi:adenylate cyclase